MAAAGPLLNMTRIPTLVQWSFAKPHHALTRVGRIVISQGHDFTAK